MGTPAAWIVTPIDNNLSLVWRKDERQPESNFMTAGAQQLLLCCCGVRANDQKGLD
jgi:hypothetical protein